MKTTVDHTPQHKAIGVGIVFNAPETEQPRVEIGIGLWSYTVVIGFGFGGRR